MPTSRADKPPICSTSPESHQEAGAPRGAYLAHVPPPSTLHHWTFLVMACVVVAASLAFTVRGEEHVIVPVLNKALPGTCTFRRFTGLPCPGCGMTRSFISIAHGQLADAWRFNPAGVVFFAVVAFQIPYRIYQIARIRRGLAEHRFVAADGWVLVGVVAILLVQWICAMTALLW